MTANMRTIDRLLLEAVSNDFERIDSIVEQIANWGALPSKLDQAEIEEALLALLKQDYVEAYTLSPSAPHFTRVQSSSCNPSEHWFYISGRGKDILRSLSIKDEETPR